MNPQPSTIALRPIAPLMAPPPLYFGVAFGIGTLIQAHWPVALSPLPEAQRILGAFTIAAGVILALALVSTFLVRRTTLNPFAEPSVLLTAGPYRLSRNPMYLSVITVYLGGTMLLGSPWPLLTMVAPLLVLARSVVPYEEAQMATTFGEAYRSYSQRVRRWI